MEFLNTWSGLSSFFLSTQSTKFGCIFHLFSQTKQKKVKNTQSDKKIGCIPNPIFLFYFWRLVGRVGQHNIFFCALSTVFFPSQPYPPIHILYQLHKVLIGRALGQLQIVLGEAKWLWRFPDGVIIYRQLRFVSLGKGAIQMQILLLLLLLL